jgi:hypothetical protein
MISLNGLPGSMLHIPEGEIKYSGYSIADSFGRVFFWDNRVFRGLNPGSVELFDEMKNIGALDELVNRKLVPETRITRYHSDKFSCILEHEIIHPISFGYEWSFDMIKAAGNCILTINQILSKYGFETNDAHPYNILFRGCKPVFIDFGSFRKINQRIPWSANEEFLGYYFYTLIFWNRVSHNMAKKIYADDINSFSSSEYEILFYRNRVFKKIANIYSKIDRKITGKLITYSRTNELSGFQYKLDKLKRKKINTLPGDYYADGNKIKKTDGFKYIIEKIKLLKIKNITQLAGNCGLLAYLILNESDVEKIICIDYNEWAINKMYNFFLNTPYSEKLSPVLMNFMKPIELSNGGRPPVRFNSEAVFALAVTHHLILANKYKIDLIFEKISEYTSKYVFVEFMPLGLCDDGSEPSVPGWYSEEWFALNFQNYFRVIDIAEMEDNRILYVGMKKTRG